MSDTAIPATAARRLAADFVALTKPRIISLLLVTTGDVRRGRAGIACSSCSSADI
jgi:hypothetical protein